MAEPKTIDIITLHCEAGGILPTPALHHSSPSATHKGRAPNSARLCLRLKRVPGLSFPFPRISPPAEYPLVLLVFVLAQDAGPSTTCHRHQLRSTLPECPLSSHLPGCLFWLLCCSPRQPGRQWKSGIVLKYFQTDYWQWGTGEKRKPGLCPEAEPLLQEQSGKIHQNTNTQPRSRQLFIAD